MSIPLRLGPANYWIRDKVLFSAWSRCALKTGHGETKKKKGEGGGIKEGHLNLGFSGSHWVRNQSSEKPLSAQADFHIRPDLSHLPGVFFFLFSPPPTTTTATAERERNNRTLPVSRRRRRKGWMERTRTEWSCLGRTLRTLILREKDDEG